MCGSYENHKIILKTNALMSTWSNRKLLQNHIISFFITCEKLNGFLPLNNIPLPACVKGYLTHNTGKQSF